ncbi:unnamed protein product [Peronospora destructor]|uniref:Cell wall protein YJL171C/Tos1 C-terminal domain-containing protein n=1 Tax=Peronospora destructor TaxID=86335 RepID=A0AAV0UYR8_9STRA|nr:unnamed protein product [Peronospora destructor]
MVKVTLSRKMAMATCLFAATAASAAEESINFINNCDHDIELFHSQSAAAASLEATIPIGGEHSLTVTGSAHMFRHTAAQSSTLFEISTGESTFYDISIIMPGSGNCASHDKCKTNDIKTGFNVPMSVVPTTNVGKDTCSSLFCAADDKDTCADAYLFPMDNTKTHNCPCGTSFDVTFCYVNSVPSVETSTQQMENVMQQIEKQTQQIENLVPSAENPMQQVGKQDGDMTKQEGDMTKQEDGNTQQPGNDHKSKSIVAGLLDVRAKYTYSDKCAGNVAGTFDAVVDLSTCTKKPVAVNSPCRTLGERHTGGQDLLKRVSYYSSAEQKTENLVFMNNAGVDFSGKNKQGPQSYASADGKEAVTEPMVFNGRLEDALDPSKIGAGPGITTGAEINIMTGEKCNENQLRRLLWTRLLTGPPSGCFPLQLLHSNQYGCNCRGMGSKGGCGELDIAEVIETNLQKNMLSTHHYFFDDNISCPGGDNFFDRKYNESTIFITIIDEANAIIKIVEVAKFDFHLLEVGSLYEQLLTC